MKSRSAWPAAERAARSRLAKLAHEEPLLCGSLVTMSHTCGKSGCRCGEGEKHVSLALATRRGGRRVMIHVPRAWEARVRSWVGNHRESRELLRALSDALLERFVREKEEASRSKRREAGRD